MPFKKKTLILTGIAGRLGRRLAHRLCAHYQIIGIDRRAVLGLPDEVIFHRLDLRRRSAEEVFRSSKAHAVLHLGVVHNFRISSEKLYERNVIGTETLLQYISKYRIPKLVLLSSGDVYGPISSNSHFIDEDSPLLASQSFPEIRTLVAVDRSVQSFFWRYPNTESVILRSAHIVGPNVRNAPSNYLRLHLIPTLLGYDPMLQLIHEDDIITMIEAALLPNIRGIFNVVGTKPLMLSKILAKLNKPVIAVPYPLLKQALNYAWRYRLTSFPAPELEHLRYSTVLDTTRAEQSFSLQPQRSLDDIVAPFCQRFSDQDL